MALSYTKVLIVFFLIYTVFSCEKDDIVKIEPQAKIVSIEHKGHNRQWIENYTYSPKNELIQIDNYRSSGTTYKMEYKNSKLQEYKTYSRDTDRLIFRDSIVYNEDGNIEAIFHFSGYLANKLSLVKRYTYNRQNQVSRKSTFFVNANKILSSERYFWDGDVITRVEYYGEDEELYYEYFYKYDNKVNYKKLIPPDFSNPLNWLNYNIIEMDWHDHYGNLDLICRPCTRSYTYNSKDYPITMRTNWDYSLKITYE